METNEPMHWTDTLWWSQIVLVAVSFAALGLFSGCSAAGVDEDSFSNSGCEESFWPDPELLEPTLHALDKWSSATRQKICLSQSGIPVHLVDSLPMKDGDGQCGLTQIAYLKEDLSYAYTLQIEISEFASNCGSLESIVLHEMGHALSRLPDNVDSHTRHGLMSAYAEGKTEIDRESLELICQNFPCL